MSKKVEYPGDEFVKRFLSNCPVLEEFVLQQCFDDNVFIWTVRVPSLKSLTVYKYHGRDGAHGFVINAPSLVRLQITDFTDGFYVIKNEMPMIETVDIDIPHSKLVRILRSVTSVKYLTLGLITEDPYPVGSVFHQLTSLTLYRCNWEWLNLLLRVLKDSPNLRALKLLQYSDVGNDEPFTYWIKPSSVPVCLLSSLETLGWDNYGGDFEEKELAEFILKNGACLKKVTISSIDTDSDKKLEIIKALTLSFRGSPTCQLAFH